MIPFSEGGNLQINNLLTNAKYIGYKKLRGPETLVFSSNGSMYTGLLNGQIVRIDPPFTEDSNKVVFKVYIRNNILV